MTSSIFAPRSRRARCSPSTQRTASETLDLPHPLGPTIAVTPASKSRSTWSAKDLNPWSSSLRSRTLDSPDSVGHRGVDPGALEHVEKRHRLRGGLERAGVHTSVIFITSQHVGRKPLCTQFSCTRHRDARTDLAVDAHRKGCSTYRAEAHLEYTRIAKRHQGGIRLRLLLPRSDEQAIPARAVGTEAHGGERRGGDRPETARQMATGVGEVVQHH